MNRVEFRSLSVERSVKTVEDYFKEQKSEKAILKFIHIFLF